MLNRFDSLKHQYTVHINLFKAVLLMLNRFDKLNLQYTMQINQFIPVLFIVNRVDMLNINILCILTCLNRFNSC